jgi:Arc/MetJ-type ribon-helix-helix transcriptional regulator
MGRTQVYLGPEELELLERLSAATGASRSELIRRAIRNTFGERSKEDKLRALDASAGAWRNRPFTGAEYVDSIRGDLNERLRSLAFE